MAAVVAVGVFAAWMWPQGDVLEKIAGDDIEQQSGLEVFPSGNRSPVWWAMLCTVAVIASIFGTLHYTYFYIRLYSYQ